MAHFACGEFPQAADNLAQAGRFAWSAPGHIHLLDYHLYSALTLSQQLTRRPFPPICAARSIFTTTKSSSGRGSIRALLPIKRR
jgi:hypothetical protein